MACSAPLLRPRLLRIIPVLLMLTGCGGLRQTPVVPANQQGHGNVHGGQQPISGATLQLYAVGSGGDGSAATPLLTHGVTSDASGNFNITGAYTCPTPSSLVYIVASGGNPGLAPGTNNAAIGLMTALGPCSSLTSSTFININELTTVGAVAALAPFMSSPSSVGSSSTDAQALADAFTLASQYVNYSTGTVPGTNVPVGTTVPIAQINTIADILAACVNSSGGIAGDSSPCGTLFSLTTPSTTPATPAGTDVITAALRIAQNPTLNTAALFNLVPAIAPFQPQLTQVPPDFSVHLIVSGPTPTLSVSPSSLTFPATTIGFPSPTQDITLTNTSQAAVQISTPSTYLSGVYGTNGFDFIPLQGDCYNLAAGASCTMHVFFAPTVAGVRLGTLSLSSNAADSPQSVSLTGTGLPLSSNQVTVSASSLAFTKFGVPQTVTVTNYGSSAVHISNIYIKENIFGNDWSQTNNCGSSLPAQSICTISVVANDLSASTVSPSQNQGVLNGALMIVDDAASGSQSVALQTTSLVSVSGPNLDFGNLPVGTTSSQQSVTANIYNRIYVNYLAFSLQLSGPNASDFSFPQGSYCAPPGYPYNVTCSLPIVFTPSASGLRTATVSSNFGNFTVSGWGNSTTSSSFYISPNPVQFPTTNLTITTGPIVATVHNTGNTTLSLATPSLSGPNANEFTASLGASCASIAPGAACTVSLSAAPAGVGQQSATLTLTDNTSGTQQSVPVITTAIISAQAPYALPHTLTFPDTVLYQLSQAQVIAVYAPNNDPVTVGGYPGTVTAQPVTCSQAGAQCFSVQVSPGSLGLSHAAITMTDTTTQAQSYIDTTVNGVPVPVTGTPAVNLSSTSITFPARSVGSTSIPVTVTLMNSGTGNAPLTISGISLAGANPSDYILINNCGTTVSTGGSCTFSISFAPVATGTRTASVQIVSNAATSPDSISLSGAAN